MDLLTDRDEASSETTTLDLTAASLSLPAGCTIVITLTIDGKAHSYTAREENGSFHFEFPFVASDTEVQAVMDVYDATGMLILTGTAEKTVSGTLDALEVALAPPAESSSDGPFTVSFDTAGGSAVAAQLVAEGASAAEPAAPTRAGYDFGGWYADPAGTAAYDFSLPVTEDITLSARWTAIEYTVTYHLPSGLTGVTVNSSGTVPDTDSYTVEVGLPSLATVTCTSVSFGGWFPSDSYTDGSEVSSIPSGTSGIPSGSGTNTDLYGKFSATISFDTGTGGSAVADLDVVYGEEAELPSPGPTKTNCVFMGWYADSGCTVPFDFSSVTESATAYARWLPVDNTIAASTSPGNSLYEFVDLTGNTSNLLTLNDFQYTADLWGTASKFVNGTPGTITTIYMDLQGTNKIIGGNHGGLKFRNSADDAVTSPGGTFEVIFTTSSSGTIELGFQYSGTGGCIQVQNVTANFSVAPGCTVSEMKIGSTTYTDWDAFIAAARANTSAYTNASFRITRD